MMHLEGMLSLFTLVDFIIRGPLLLEGFMYMSHILPVDFLGLFTLWMTSHFL
jgi:hypothetical protein